MPNRPMSVGRWLLLLITAASVASSVLFNKILVGELPPITLAALRALLALPLCLVVLRLTGRSLPRSLADRLTVLKAALGVIVIPYCALAIGQRTIAGGLSGILYSTMPLFTLVAAQFMLPDERLGLRKLAGVAFGMAGVAAVIGPSLIGGLGEHVIAELITLLGPLAYAVARVVMRRSHHLDPIGLTAGLFVAATVILVPLAFIVEQPLAVRIGAATAGWLLALTVLGTITFTPGPSPIARGSGATLRP